MNLKDLAQALTQKAADARLAQDKASTEGKREVAAMYAGQSTAYAAAAVLTGETTEGDVQHAVDEALYA